MDRFQKTVKLRNGKTTEIGIMTPKVTARQLMEFINEIIDEQAFIVYQKKFNLKQENEWKLQKLKDQKSKNGFVLVATVDNKLAGTSEARRDKLESVKQNIGLGIAISKEYRGLGLGEALLRANIELTKKFFKPKPRIVYLTVFADNKIAQNLYRKVGFKKFATFPKWRNHYGKFVDEIFMKL